MPDIRPIHPVPIGVVRLALGFKLPGTLPGEDWRALLLAEAMTLQASRWRIGDLLVHGEDRYGEMYDDATAATGLQYGTLANLKAVAAGFEFSRRRENLSVSHHVEVLPLPEAEQERLLDRAAAEGWTRVRLREAVRTRTTELRAALRPRTTTIEFEVRTETIERPLIWYSTGESNPLYDEAEITRLIEDAPPPEFPEQSPPIAASPVAVGPEGPTRIVARPKPVTIAPVYAPFWTSGTDAEVARLLLKYRGAESARQIAELTLQLAGPPR